MPMAVWLPDSALHGDVADRTLRSVAQRWSERWFARQMMAPVDVAAHETERQSAGARCRIHRDGLAVSASEGARLALAGLMLGVAIGGTRLNASDRVLLLELAEACLDDLCTELGDAFGLGDRALWDESEPLASVMRDGTTSWLGVHAGAPLIEIGVTRSATIALIKSQAAVVSPPLPLAPLSSALTDLPVDVTARLGCCDLTLAEFARLGPGDVIVLDRPIAQPLELALGGEPTVARCAVRHDGAALQLKILQPLRG